MATIGTRLGKLGRDSTAGTRQPGLDMSVKDQVGLDGGAASRCARTRNRVAHRLAEARDPPQGSVALKTSVGFVLVVGVVLLLAGAHSGLLDGYGASQLVLT